MYCFDEDVKLYRNGHKWLERLVEGIKKSVGGISNQTGNESMFHVRTLVVM